MNHYIFIKGLLLFCLSSTTMSAQPRNGHTHSGRDTGQPPFPLETYQELPNPIAADKTLWQKVKGTRIGWGSTDVRYKKEEPALVETSTERQLIAWRGERVAAQFVISTSQKIDRLSFDVSDLKKVGSDYTIAKSQIFKGFVRYVMTDELNKDGRGGCGYRPHPEFFDSTLVADPIDHLTPELQLHPCTSQGCWLRVQVPQNAEPGLYAGQVVVRNGNQVLGNLDLKVQVKSRVLPEPRKWHFHLDLWQNPYAIARYHQVEPWSPEHFEAMKPYMELYRDAGGKVITASIMHKPWDGQTHDYFESMVKWIKKKDGSWKFDFDIFDRWVEFMVKLGINGQIDCYSMIPWKTTFRYYDERLGQMKDAVTRPGERLYEKMWKAMLTAFADHLKDKHWFKRTCISMDERPIDQMRTVIDLVKSVDPAFKITLAGELHEDMMTELHDYSVPLNRKFYGDELHRRQEAGQITTFYTCCSEPYPNTFTFCEPADAEWLGWYAAKEHLDGYLRWALNSWVIEPLLDSRFHTWAAGDTYLIYPGGRTSVRFERLVDGIQAYEKVRILRNEFEQNADWEAEKQLNEALAAFQEQTLPQHPSAEVVQKGHEVLESLTFEAVDTGIESAETNQVQVRVQEGSIYIQNAPLHAPIRICRIDGTLVTERIMSGNSLQIALPLGIYIVQIEGRSYKVQL